MNDRRTQMELEDLTAMRDSNRTWLDGIMEVPKMVTPAIFTKRALEKCLGDYMDKDFTLEEDDHIMTLYHDKQFVARWNAHLVTFEELQNACCQHLNQFYNEGISYGAEG